ncbi:phage major capsid protein [Listeria monocytogenes]|nr:phage major capsid protein [Listeria monocytogenes]
MSLLKKRENLKKIKDAIAVKKSDLAQIKKDLGEKEKSATDEDLTSLHDKAQALADDIDALIAQESIAEEDVSDAEQELADIVEASKSRIEKSKNDKRVGNDKYLDTKEALKDFADILQRNPEDASGVQKAWGAKLKEKNITNPTLLVPTPVATAIKDAFEKSGSIFSTFNHTGLNAWRVMLNTEEGDVGLARGHKRGTDKDDQSITLDDKVIRAQYIYKYLTLDKETIRENSDTGALLKYVLEELPQRVVMEIEKAAIVGDGRATSSDDKIYAYEAIIDADDIYMTKVDAVAANSLIVDLVKLDALVQSEGQRYLVMNRITLAELKVATDANGSLMYPIGTDMASVLGVDTIFTPQWFPTRAPGVPIAVEYAENTYRTVGDNAIDSYENFILAKNKNEYLAELYSGGALSEFKSGATLMQPTTSAPISADVPEDVPDVPLG